MIAGRQTLDSIDQALIEEGSKREAVGQRIEAVEWEHQALLAQKAAFALGVE